MPTALLKIRNITKYFGQRIILNNLSFEVQTGEILGLIGASGSGKTTLLHTLIGFLKPEGGDVLILAKRNPSEYSSIYAANTTIRHLVGFASQIPSFYPKLTIAENLEYFGKLYGLSDEAIAHNSEKLLEVMELSHASNVFAQNLSGGMERRLDIACALIHDPPLLILDEPTADLDPSLRLYISDLLKLLNKKGTTVIIASHHLHDIESLCSRVLIMNKGKLLQLGTPAQIHELYKKETSISIETFPGNYTALIPKIKESSQIKGTRLHVTTEDVPSTLQRLLALLEKSKENLVDITINKPTLENVFFSMYAKPKKKTVQKEESAPSDEGIEINVQ